MTIKNSADLYFKYAPDKGFLHQTSFDLYLPKEELKLDNLEYVMIEDLKENSYLFYPSEDYESVKRQRDYWSDQFLKTTELLKTMEKELVMLRGKNELLD